MRVDAFRSEARELASLRAAVTKLSEALGSEALGADPSNAPTAASWQNIAEPPALAILGLSAEESRTAFVRSRLSADHFALVRTVTAHFNRTPGELGAAVAELSAAEFGFSVRFRNWFEETCRNGLSSVAAVRRAGAKAMRAGFVDIGELGVERSFRQSLSLYLTLKTDLPLMITAGLGEALSASAAARVHVPGGQLVHAPPVWPPMPSGAAAVHPFESLHTTAGHANADARAAIRAYVGVRTDAAGRLRLIRDWPILAFAAREFRASDLIACLFSVQLADHLRMFIRVIDAIDASNAAFERDILGLSDKAWRRYAPFVLQMGRWLEDDGFPAPLVAGAVGALVGADPGLRTQDTAASILTVLAIVCGVFGGPLVALGAGVVSGLASFAVRAVDLLDASAENKSRAALAYGHPDAEVLAEVIEHPSNLAPFEVALLIETVFLSASVAPIVKAVRSPSHLAAPPSMTLPRNSGGRAHVRLQEAAREAEGRQAFAAAERRRIDRHLAARDAPATARNRALSAGAETAQLPPPQALPSADTMIREETVANGRLAAAAARERALVQQQTAVRDEISRSLKAVKPSPVSVVKEGERIKALDKRIDKISSGQTRIAPEKRQAEIDRLRERRAVSEDIRTTYRAARGATTAPTIAIDRFTEAAKPALEKLARLEKQLLDARKSLTTARAAHDKARDALEATRARLARMESFEKDHAATLARLAKRKQDEATAARRLARAKARRDAIEWEKRAYREKLLGYITYYADQGGKLDALRDETLKRMLIQLSTGADPLLEVNLLMSD